MVIRWNGITLAPSTRTLCDPHGINSRSKEIIMSTAGQALNTTGTSHSSAPNVGKTERIASTIAGGALLGYSFRKPSATSVLLAALGAGLLHRGVTGHCEAYHSLGIDHAQSNTSSETSGDDVARDVHVEKSVIINSSPAELYRFWRNFENLPQFMEGLESVTSFGDGRSHWIATGPAGKQIEWDAEIYNEKTGELIAWRSLPGADIVNAGSVNFEPAVGGTRVRVTFNYNPPAGAAGVLVAKIFNDDPADLVERNLQKLKELAEGDQLGMSARAATSGGVSIDRHR